jgi:ArsR family transcriptional regulator
MDEIQELAETFKALSDPTRLRLLRLLGTRKGPLCVNALAGMLGVTQSAVSQHLRVLRQAGLVQGERRGCFVHYTLAPAMLQKYRYRILKALGEDLAIVE